MPSIRQTILLCYTLLGLAVCASAQESAEKGLQRELANTADPRKRIELLLNLKDQNEETTHDLPYSIQLFREGIAIGDTYAMSAAINSIINRYAIYAEKQDSLRYYLRALQTLTPGTPEEGLDSYAEMGVLYKRMNSEGNRKTRIQLAHRTLRWCDSLVANRSNIYQQTTQLTLRGYANVLIINDKEDRRSASILQIPIWEQAYKLATQMPEISIRQHFTSIIYSLLSDAYNQSRRYADQLILTNSYIEMLDSYYADKKQLERLYLYTDNSYFMPYNLLIRSAINIGRKDYAKRHFDDFRHRMLQAEGVNLTRNKTYLYETGYLWKNGEGDYAQSIQYCDSLIKLIERGEGYYRMMPAKIYQTYHNYSRLLRKAGRYKEACIAYNHTLEVQNSFFKTEQFYRTEAIRHSHEMDRLKLNKARNMIRNRLTATLSFVAIGLLLLGVGIYLYRALHRNRLLEANILRHNKIAQESERMKSTFINTICRGIGPPLEALDHSAHKLITTEINSSERQVHLEAVRENTQQLLSVLDNMLEAANLDSLSERLRLERADIDELCRAELLTASRLHHDSGVTYTIESPGTQCIVLTHAKYFSFVVRSLLDNASRFTKEGSITLRYELRMEENLLVVTVTDTGCGIAPERHDTIFRSFHDHQIASRGLSLALCSLIAEHLSGSICLDKSYPEGARFIFTIPAQP